MSPWKRLHIFFSDHFCFIKPPEEEKSWGNGLSSCFSLFSVPRSDLLLGPPVRTGNLLIKSKSCSFSTFHSYQMSSRCPETRMLQKKKGVSLIDPLPSHNKSKGNTYILTSPTKDLQQCLMILFSNYFKNMSPPTPNRPIREKLLSRCNERLLLQKKMNQGDS